MHVTVLGNSRQGLKHKQEGNCPAIFMPFHLTLSFSHLPGLCCFECYCDSVQSGEQNPIKHVCLSQGAPCRKSLFGTLKRKKKERKEKNQYELNQCKLKLCPGTNCVCPGLKCQLRSDPEVCPKESDLPVCDDMSTLIWESQKKKYFCDLMLLAASRASRLQAK